MKKRLILLAGLGAGFILGSRAGRESYEKLKAQAEQWWGDPRVQDSVDKVRSTVEDRLPPEVQEKVGTAAEQMKEQAQNLGAKAQESFQKVKDQAAEAKATMDEAAAETAAEGAWETEGGTPSDSDAGPSGPVVDADPDAPGRGTATP